MLSTLIQTLGFSPDEERRRLSNAAFALHVVRKFVRLWCTEHRKSRASTASASAWGTAAYNTAAGDADDDGEGDGVDDVDGDDGPAGADVYGDDDGEWDGAAGWASLPPGPPHCHTADAPHP